MFVAGVDVILPRCRDEVLLASATAENLDRSSEIYPYLHPVKNSRQSTD